MMDELTLGSLFSGSGGFELGGILSGIRPVWNSEIEPFPIRVTTKRMPFVKHYGDIKKLSGRELEPVDIITFGSPCTDMSVAGKRAGLGGSQSSLFFDAIRIVKEMRDATDGRYPEYIVWENVTGAFSSNGGQDFFCVLEEICGIKEIALPFPGPSKWKEAGCILADGFSLAWRVLNAEHWGVPQRRRRIYLVADLAGGSAPEILFEPEGMQGDTPPRRQPWKAFARGAQGGPGKAGGLRNVNGDGGALMFDNHMKDARYSGPLDKAKTVTAHYGTGGDNQPLVLARPRTLKIRSGCEGGGKGALVQEDKSATLGTSNDQTLFQPRTFDVRFTSEGTKNARGHCRSAETARCLDGSKADPDSNHGGIAVVAPSHAFYMSGNTHFKKAGMDLADTLTARDYKEPPLVKPLDGGCVYAVRRLTPLECGRLQGFPDWWCEGLETEDPSDEEVRRWKDIFAGHACALGKNIKRKTDYQVRKWLKGPFSDAAIYKMWGNGVALPCVEFVLSGIARAARRGEAGS